MNGNIATPPTSSTVEVSAQLLDSDEIVSCDIPVQHQSGAPDGNDSCRSLSKTGTTAAES